MNTSLYLTAKNWQPTESKRFALDCGVALTHAQMGGSVQRAIRGVVRGGKKV